MKNKDFNISEILESVDFIVKAKDNKNYNNRKTIDKHKKFSNQKVDTPLNRDVEKIIIDAEKADDSKKIDNNFSEPLILNNLKPEETSSIERNTLLPNSAKPLILLNELKEVNVETKMEKNISAKQNEKIKNLKSSKRTSWSALLGNFQNQEKHSNLDKMLKLYQEDNVILRKKILILEDTETSLRLKLAEVNLDKNIK